MRLANIIAVVLLAFTGVAAANAQIAPGLAAPSTKIRGFAQAQNFGCFLALARRPVPGLNMDAPDLMGEGLTTEEHPPAWLSESFTFDDSATFSRLQTGEGDVWIAFEQADNRCTILSEVTMPDEFRYSLESAIYADKSWTLKDDDPAVDHYYYSKVYGLEFRSSFPESRKPGTVFAVQIITN